jgi:hypothetical protein
VRLQAAGHNAVIDARNPDAYDAAMRRAMLAIDGQDRRAIPERRDVTPLRSEHGLQNDSLIIKLDRINAQTHETPTPVA